MRFVIVENRQLLPQASLSGPARIPGTKPHSPQQPYELSALWLLMPSNSNRVLKKIFFSYFHTHWTVGLWVPLSMWVK